MISISRLLCGDKYFGDSLRYSSDSKTASHGTNHGRGPVVVWNCTRTCNLNCIHCYSSSQCKQYSGELTTEQGLDFITDLANFKVPVVLFSGGEPLMRPDIFELLGHAKKLNVRPTLSTNGTLITKDIAKQLKSIGVGYVGVSLDGIGENHDRFRGKKGAFDQALQGIRNCLAIGQRVGLRFTMNRHNFQDLPEIFRLIEEENIPRVCFYHLVYIGRGKEMMKDDLTHEQSREALELIANRVEYFYKKGEPKEILTVDNHADGIYLYLRQLRRDPKRAERIRELLLQNGGNRTGIAISAVDWLGNVHPDQFSQDITFGNVKERKFSQIWQDETHPILAGLRKRKPLLKGRCAQCGWLEVCNGNFRSRAHAVTGDYWESDPACYLTEDELKLGGEQPDYLLEYHKSV